MASHMSGVGRPPRIGPISEQDRERGRRVAAWIRKGMTRPHRDVEIKNPDLAELIGKGVSTVGYYLNECYDRSKDRMIFPTVDTIRVIAEKLRLDPDEGIKARYWVSEIPSSKAHFGIHEQLPQAGGIVDENTIKLFAIIFERFQRHAYEGKISEAELEKVMNLMLQSIPVNSSTPPELLANYSDEAKNE